MTITATARSSPTISEPLTWQEICQRYPDEWVCLVEFDRLDPTRFAYRTARVVGHSKDRREAVEQSRPWWRHCEEIGQHFTGRNDPCLATFPRCFVRIDLPWNPVPRFHPCHELDAEDSMAAAQARGEP